MSSAVILDSNNKDDGKIEDIDDNDDGKENNKFRGGVGDVSTEIIVVVVIPISIVEFDSYV